MCQLTLANFGSAKLNSLYLYNQMIINSRTTNQDGCGFFVPEDTVRKTKLPPIQVNNFGKILKAVRAKDPIIGHVRQASYVPVKIISDESAHPFNLNNIVLAHNGTLESKTGLVEKEARFKEKIDSEIFATLLDESYAIDKDLVKSLKDLYDLFYGKFAFLIFDKLNKKYYIAKGEADLYLSNVTIMKDGSLEKFGFALNTNREDLLKALMITLNLAEYQYGVNFGWEVPEEVGKNSIYLLEDNALKKVDDLVEEKKPYIYQGGKYNNQGFFQDEKTTQKTEKITTPITTVTTYVTKSKDKTQELIDEVLDFMWTCNLTVEDIDEILFHVLGIPLSAIVFTDLETLVDKIIPKLKAKFSEQKNVAKSWSILQKVNSYDIDYKKLALGKFQFPYFLNPVADIRKIIKETKGNIKDEEIAED